MNRLKNYNFWLSIISAGLLICQTVFDVNFDSAYTNEIISGVLGLFVVIGIINDPTKSNSSEDDKYNKIVETIKSICDNIELLKQSNQNAVNEGNSLSEIEKNNNISNNLENSDNSTVDFLNLDSSNQESILNENEVSSDVETDKVENNSNVDNLDNALTNNVTDEKINTDSSKDKSNEDLSNVSTNNECVKNEQNSENKIEGAVYNIQ